MNVLVVDQEPKTLHALQRGLEAVGFSVTPVGSAEQGLRRATASSYDAIVSEVLLPGMSGLEMMRRLREAQVQTPLLFVSVKATLEDRVMGLERGADDYLGKPCAMSEVVARLRAISRRHRPLPQTRTEVADLIWEPAQRRISRAGRRLDLTPKEYDLAALLLKHLGQVVPRALIVQALWGTDVPAESNAVDVQMLRLRRKLDGPYANKLIHTQRGVGVVLEDRSGR